jgi:hypothetical protein
MSYGRFRRDPAGVLVAPKNHCTRCFRVFQSDAKERELVHSCRECAARQKLLLEVKP